MAKLNFKVSAAPKQKIAAKPKPKKVVLEKHVTSMATNEYYTYIGIDGEEHKYTGILTKSELSAYGKIFEDHKVDLIYHPEIKHVDAVSEYFSYIDENGNEHIFRGKVEFDLERNTYFGILREKEIKEEMIQIFEEK